MNIKIANALSGYIEILYEMNKSIIKLCGVDCMYEFDNPSNIMFNVIGTMPRLIPIKYCKDTLQLQNDDGLLEFSDELPYLKEYYQKILNENYKVLDSIRKVRNKYEHKIHGAKAIMTGSDSRTYYSVVFELDLRGKKEEVIITVNQLISIVRILNNMFDEIIKEIKNYAEENDKINYRYYERLLRFSFVDFNDIYDSKILKKVGKIMYDF